jgi:isopentenyl-diphosphate delta-isomerase
MALENVILVDEQDREVGLEEKLSAHRQGLLHRAISVLIHDRHGRWLLQRRAMEKYHSGRLWTNACCSHPRAGEAPTDAARRRLDEELGFTTDVRFIGNVRYCSDLGKGMIENELVHVFTGRFNGDIRPDPAEVEGYDWLFEHELRADILVRPERYTVWFKKYVAELRGELTAA